MSVDYLVKPLGALACAALTVSALWKRAARPPPPPVPLLSRPSATCNRPFLLPYPTRRGDEGGEQSSEAGAEQHPALCSLSLSTAQPLHVLAARCCCTFLMLIWSVLACARAVVPRAGGPRGHVLLQPLLPDEGDRNLDVDGACDLGNRRLRLCCLSARRARSTPRAPSKAEIGAAQRETNNLQHARCVSCVETRAASLLTSRPLRRVTPTTCGSWARISTTPGTSRSPRRRTFRPTRGGATRCTLCSRARRLRVAVGAEGEEAAGAPLLLVSGRWPAAAARHRSGCCGGCGVLGQRRRSTCGGSSFLCLFRLIPPRPRRQEAEAARRESDDADDQDRRR